MQAHRSSLLLAAAALLALCVASEPIDAQRVRARSELELRHLAETRDRYAQPSWPRGAVRGGIANEPALVGWVLADIDAEQGLVTRAFRRAASPLEAEAPPSFVLESIVTDSAEAAHDAVLEWLAGVQSPQRMPALSELGLSIGDVGFAGRAGAAPDALAWIVLARGNVALRLSACDPLREPELDLGALAAAIDRGILARPELESGRARPARPEILRLAAPRTTVVAGEVLSLEVEVADPASGTPHLRWTIGGPGQGYVERAADGTWELHTTGPGALRLELEATGSTGTWTQRELRLDVLDD